MNLLFDKSLVQNTASGIALVNEKSMVNLWQEIIMTRRKLQLPEAYVLLSEQKHFSPFSSEKNVCSCKRVG